ncbi:hypothetical protein H2198_004226 [Neophaeococcomyces mojaviensis]|uniref:Uncharacterized protein n=1 Tax=Neophaeococcomyces mojaviensis TaxID=3383035 RepID=A0ACC3A981_9EURO|nr:hypothetical protein H2198_004226 [Knufia sp. JES_112]
MHTLRVKGAYIHENMLMSLLLRAPKLQSLSISPTLIDGEAHNLWDEDSEVLAAAVLSPVNIRRLLLPVREHLEKLTILDVGVLEMDAMNPSHDGTQLDLASFHRLKTLTLSNACLFGGCTSARQAPNVQHLLPSTLEHLTIAFPRKAGVFYSLGEMKSALLNGNDAWNRLWLERTAWGRANELQMLGLVVNTMRPTRLRTLNLLEDNSCGWTSRYTNVVRWRTNQLNCLSGEVVNFVVELRVPQTWQTDLEAIKSG